MCSRVNAWDLSTIYHEMGHIVYFMAYSNQPAIYRGGANTAFHEAIGTWHTLNHSFIDFN